MVRASTLIAMVILTLASLPGSARAQIASGPEAAAKQETLKAFAATGDLAGKSVDFVAERKNLPTVYVFVRADQWSRPMARFLRTLDEEMAKGIEGAKDARTVAVWLTEDQGKSKEYLPIAQQSVRFERTTLAVFEGDRFGPADWSVNSEAFLTAVVVKDGKVVKSFGYISLNETDVPEVVKALKAQ